MEQLPCPAIHGAAVSCLLLKSTPWPKGFQCDLALQGAIPNLRSNSCPGWRRRLPSRAVWAGKGSLWLSHHSLEPWEGQEDAQGKALLAAGPPLLSPRSLPQGSLCTEG